MGIETFVDLNLYQLGQEAHEMGHLESLTRKERFLFCYILSGRGILSAPSPDGRQGRWNLIGGQGFVVFPGQERRFQVNSILCKYMWLEFGGLRASGAVKAAGLSPENPVYRNQVPGGEDKVKEEITYLICHRNMAPHHLMGHLYLFLDALCPFGASSDRECQEGGRQETYVRKALGFIENNFQNGISVEDIADTCGLNRSYFGKIFKEAMGKTTQEFLLCYRMAKAAELLRQPQYSVGDVGSAVGYENPLHFSRAFKNTYGISPRKWRNQQRRSS